MKNYDYLESIVEKNNIIKDSSAMSAYATNTSFHIGTPPTCAVKVRCGAEIHEIVKWANSTGTPLVPVSSSGLHRKGGSTPDVAGAVIVDMSGMNRIISVSRKHRMAVIEPGVTYPQLRAALAENGLRISEPLAPRPGKSVLTAMLETIPPMNYSRQWNYIDPLTSTETIWGNGDHMCTGEAYGGSFDPLVQQAQGKFQLSGSGPSMIDYYRLLTGAQGSLGIVAWAAVKCNVLPDHRKILFAASDKQEKINELVYKMLMKRYGDQLLILNSAQFCMLAGIPFSPDIPTWIAIIGVGGRPASPLGRLEAHEDGAIAAAKELEINISDSFCGLHGKFALQLLDGRDDKVYWKDAPKGASADIFFITTLDKSAEFAKTAKHLGEKHGIAGEDIGIYIQPQHQGSSCRVEVTVAYDPQNSDSARRYYIEAGERFSQMGAYYSQPYGDWAKLQMKKDPAGWKMLRKVKRIFDGNNILNPGKLYSMKEGE